LDHGVQIVSGDVVEQADPDKPFPAMPFLLENSHQGNIKLTTRNIVK